MWFPCTRGCSFQYTEAVREVTKNVAKVKENTKMHQHFFPEYLEQAQGAASVVMLAMTRRRDERAAAAAAAAATAPSQQLPTASPKLKPEDIMNVQVTTRAGELAPIAAGQIGIANNMLAMATPGYIRMSSASDMLDRSLCAWSIRAPKHMSTIAPKAIMRVPAPELIHCGP